MSLCVYVHVCMCVCMCLYACTCVCVCVYVCVGVLERNASHMPGTEVESPRRSVARGEAQQGQHGQVPILCQRVQRAGVYVYMCVCM